jgi:natural product biosynthesis luciferase-like monooxygenase protein/amino acid adenylation domain-containing protein
MLDAYALSPMQQGMLFQSLYGQELGKDITQVICEMRENLNLPRFEQAWREAVQNHPILRTSFHWDGLPRPEQRVHREVHLPITHKNIDGWTEEERDQWLEKDRLAGFELSVPPLFRVALLQKEPASWECIFTYHHILLDARSLGVLFQSVFNLYQEEPGSVEARGTRPSFKDFILGLSGLNQEHAESFWRETLKGFSHPTRLPFARKTEKSSGTHYGEQEVRIGSTVTTGLRALAQSHDCTLNNVVQCAWGLLLSRYSGENDVVFGALRAGRRGIIEGAEDVAGLFINTVPVRFRISSDFSVVEALKQLRQDWKAIRPHEQSALAQIQSWSEIPKGKPLFETVLNFQDPAWDAILKAQGGDWTRRNFSIRSQPGYPLALDIYAGEEMVVKIGYDRCLFTEKAIQRILGHWQTILQAMASRPQTRLLELPILTQEERQQLLVEWNATQVPFQQNLCVHELFEVQASQAPDGIAVSCGESSISYGELNLRSNQLANYLRTLGVGPEVLVGVFMDRSIEMIVGLLAILKAGGAYVPLDPAYPRDRIAFMIEETQMPALVTQSALLEELPPHRAQTICLDAIALQHAARGAQSQVKVQSGVAPGNLAYVIYTSGSTGRPKGVEIEHRSLLNLVAWHQRAYSVSPADRATHLAGVSFDASVWEIWPYLTAGASVHIPDEETRLSPAKLVQWLAAKKVTLTFLPTPLAEAVMAETLPENSTLNVLLTGGDRLLRRPPETAKYILVNHYGPTENTVVTTWGRIAFEHENHAPPVIGRAIANSKVYILDPSMDPVPAGVPGELYIGGIGLARGYHRRPDLTQERFIPNPFATEPGSRLYRTGDLVRYLDDGSIEYLGRLDQQVKIRGHRIEIGEIEFALRQQTGLKEAIVTPRQSRTGEQQLVAYLVPEIDQVLTPAIVREALRNKLPEAMIPAAFVFLDALPLTPNGKLDRNALPEPTYEQENHQVEIHPRTPTEEMLAGIWQEVLGLERAGVYSNFFELGGHSLLATQVMSRVRSVFQADLPLGTLFENPTITTLAAIIDRSSRRLSLAPQPPLLPAAPQGELSLSFAQERLWFLEQLEPGQPFNNIPAAVRIRGILNRTALEKSVNEIVRRHESFRTRFMKVRGRPVALVEPSQQIIVTVVQIKGTSSTEQAAEARQLMQEEARRAFDLTKSPLLRVTLLEVGPEESILLVTMHHIISDGWSMGVFYKELTELYRSFAGEGNAPLPQPHIQYSDYARWQREWLAGPILEQQLAYWKHKLQGSLPALDLPTDYPRPAVQTYRGATEPFRLSPDLTSQIKALARRENVTLYMLLLSAFQTLLHRYSGQEDILVGSPIAGRTRREVEGLIGLFLNTLIFRASVDGQMTFQQLLEQARKMALEAYAHQDLPFEKLVDSLHIERDLSRPPVFQAMFVLQNTPLPPMEMAGLTLEPTLVESGTAKFDLTFVLEEAEDGLRGYMEYNTALFEPATIERMLGHYSKLLEGVAKNPQTRLAEIPLLTEGERHLILEEWNDTRADYPADKCIHHQFEEQVSRTPDAVAVVFENRKLTYRELNNRANHLARHLQSLGVGPEVRVGICARRSLEMVIGLMAIHKAGGAYVPLDPSYPKDRVAYMLEDSQAPVLLTQKEIEPTLTIPAGAKTVLLDNPMLWNRSSGTENPESNAIPDNVAYVIYTSGSTGKPKGVMVRHRNAVNFFTGMDQRLGRNPGVWLAVTSISFDISVLELLWTLTRGFKVVVQSDEGAFGSAERRPRTVQHKMDYSLFYFSSDAGCPQEDRYRLLIEGARQADKMGFCAVWTPERHFHAFGGMFPNPSVTSAALAMVTERVQLRAGSVVLPLHHPIRVAEEWAMVDNLSKGRAAISIAWGWNTNDFVFAPGNYGQRKENLVKDLQTIRQLWRGETISLPGVNSEPVPVKLYPSPFQSELPVWMTSSGDPDTFRLAGELGINLLTHLSGQSREQLAEKIQIYREAWAKAGHAGEGIISLMLHTFIGPSMEEVWQKVQQPLYDYLKTYRNLSQSYHPGQQCSPARNQAGANGDAASLDLMLRDAVDRYFKNCGLFGTPETCLKTVDQLRSIGVNEIACLIDFGIPTDEVLASMQYLNQLREMSNREVEEIPEDYSIPAQIRRHGVTHFQCTPSLAGMLFQDTQAQEAFKSVQTMLLGGEAFPPALAEQLKIVPHVINMYGPTETTIWSTTHRVTGKGTSIPIGRPIANTEIYIVDRGFQPVPIGVPGELLIGGAGVVRGYLNRPELTAERFVPNTFNQQPGSRLYRTGDLARYLHDGTIEFLGRLDHQVKLRGFRIELGEIEAALRTHPQVRDCVVVLKQFSADDKRLVAYLVSEGEPKPKPIDLRRALKDKLPEYMVPGAFIFLPQLPLTPNGKIDRKALPEPEGMRPTEEVTFTPAENTTEKTIAQIWQEILRVERVGLNDNFFDLGGNSLLVVQAQARICEALQVDFPVIKLFQYTTVGTLAKFLGEHRTEKPVFASALDRARRQRQAFAALSTPATNR